MSRLCIIKRWEGLGQTFGQTFGHGALVGDLSHLSPLSAVKKVGTFATHTRWGHGLVEIGGTPSQSLCGR